MKNKEITVYELIGLIKDDKAPKKIKYNNIILEYDEISQDYKANTCFNDDTNYLLYHLFRYSGALNEKIEIIPEENDEWEDIEDVRLNGKNIGYGILKGWLDFTPNHNEQKICSCIETLGIVLNKLIKNQKYLKGKLKSKDE